MSEPRRRRRVQTEHNYYVPEQEKTYIMPQDENDSQRMVARDQAQVSGGDKAEYYVPERPTGFSKQQIGFRFTDEQLDSLNRSQMIIVLQDCHQMLSHAFQVYNELKKVSGEIDAIQNKYQDILNGNLGSKKIIIGVVASLFFVSITKSGLIGLILGVAFTALILFLNKQLFAQKRQEKAEAYIQSALPPAQRQKQQLKEEFGSISTSDSWYNTQRLLPEDYWSPDAVAALITLLKTRRARTLAEAFDAYENQLHRQRIEEMEQQKLQMARETAAAQTEAARVQTRAAQEQSRAAQVQTRAAREQSRAAQEQRRAAQEQSYAAQAQHRAAQTQRRAAKAQEQSAIEWLQIGNDLFR